MGTVRPIEAARRLGAVSKASVSTLGARRDQRSPFDRYRPIVVNAGAKLHRFPEQNCINNADENGLEHGLFSWASGLGRIVGRRVGVVAA